MVWTQRGDGRHADWALPDDAVGVTAAVVSLDEAVLDPDDERRPRCPVCGIPAPMLAAATSCGERYDLCPDCGLLWHVDRKRGVVVGIRWGAARDVGGP